jgi:hypothetical protein
MRLKRFVLVGLLLLAVTGAIALALLSFGVFDRPTAYRQVPPGDQEIVVLMPATSGDGWERLLAATDALQTESSANRGNPRLRVDKKRAFVEQTADVPEVALSVDGCDRKLWIRWYKLTGPYTAEKWMKELAERPTPPLAIIGGETSGRARLVGEALEAYRGQWQGAAPVLLITTATADQFDPNDAPADDATRLNWPQLINIYKGRSFRFSFTNSRMAEVVLDFVRAHDDLLWPRAVPHAVPAASLTAQPDILSQLTTLAVQPLLGCTLHSVKWLDDSYSVDLADRFSHAFETRFTGPRGVANDIPYSAGDFFNASHMEVEAILVLVPEIRRLRNTRQLLVLPTGAEQARRFLRTLLRTTGRPDVKNLVVVTGDSINFNTLYRDHVVTWNIRDLEVPLVLFSHRTPVDAAVGFRKLDEAKTLDKSTGTEELLLYRDILQAVLLCAYRSGQLVDSADKLLENLRLLDWVDGRIHGSWSETSASKLTRRPGLLFDSLGNRSKDTGEHVIVLLPEPNDQGIVVSATITVWRLRGDPRERASWKEVEKLSR